MHFMGAVGCGVALTLNVEQILATLDVVVHLLPCIIVALEDDVQRMKRMMRLG